MSTMELTDEQWALAFRCVHGVQTARRASKRSLADVDELWRELEDAHRDWLHGRP